MHLRLPCEPAAAAMARAMLAPVQARTDARLSILVTELVTNAVRHGGGAVEVDVEEDDGRLRVEVADGGTGFDGAAQLAIDGTAHGGFGLKIVDHMADRWGVKPGLVWFELDL